MACKGTLFTATKSYAPIEKMTILLREEISTSQTILLPSFHKLFCQFRKTSNIILLHKHDPETSDQHCAYWMKYILLKITNICNKRAMMALGRSPEYHWNQIISKSVLRFSRRNLLKLFSIYSPGGHFVQQSRTVWAVFVDSHLRNIPV